MAALNLDARRISNYQQTTIKVPENKSGDPQESLATALIHTAPVAPEGGRMDARRLRVAGTTFDIRNSG